MESNSVRDSILNYLAEILVIARNQLLMFLESSIATAKNRNGFNVFISCVYFT